MNPNLTELKSEAAVGAMLATDAANPIMINGIPHVLRSEGQELDDLEELLAAPTRLKQVAQLGTPAALVAYVTLFADKARSIIFANAASHSFDAVLDYHAKPDAPSWNAHRAKLTLIHTQAWKDWSGANKRAMNQADFAQFLEDHIPDIGTPSGASLVELARNFEATKAVTFQSSQRVTDGSVQFTYNEDVQGSPKAGSMKMPPEILLVVSVFEGSPVSMVKARLRYRIGEGGKLALWFDLLGMQNIVDEAFKSVLAKVTMDTADSVRAVLEGSVA